MSVCMLLCMLCRALLERSRRAGQSRWRVHAECSVLPRCGEQQSRLCDPVIGRIVTPSPFCTSVAPTLTYIISCRIPSSTWVIPWLSFTMPKDNSSTERRKRLAAFIEERGTIMVKPCATCAKHGRVCRVHVRSGKCSECLRRNQRCDIRVSQSEWDRLKQERKRLRDAIKDAYHAQEQARKEADLARERQQTAFASGDAPSSTARSVG